MEACVAVPCFSDRPAATYRHGRRLLDLAIIFLIVGNSFSAADYCCHVTRASHRHLSCRGGPTAAARWHPPCACFNCNFSEAEVEYVNWKSILLFSALNPVDGDSERAADEIAASARSPFARVTNLRRRRLNPIAQVAIK